MTVARSASPNLLLHVCHQLHRLCISMHTCLEIQASQIASVSVIQLSFTADKLPIGANRKTYRSMRATFVIVPVTRVVRQPSSDDKRYHLDVAAVEGGVVTDRAIWTTVADWHNNRNDAKCKQQPQRISRPNRMPVVVTEIICWQISLTSGHGSVCSSSSIWRRTELQFDWSFVFRLCVWFALSHSQPLPAEKKSCLYQ